MPAWEAAEQAKRTGEPWLLVTDADQKPRGWVAADELKSLPREATAGDAQLSPYGHTFGVGTDSLRAALDATLLSPAGRAVGVDEQGRVVGVTSYQRLGTAVEAAARPRTSPGRRPGPVPARPPGQRPGPPPKPHLPGRPDRHGLVAGPHARLGERQARASCPRCSG